MQWSDQELQSLRTPELVTNSSLERDFNGLQELNLRTAFPAFCAGDLTHLNGPHMTARGFTCTVHITRFIQSSGGFASDASAADSSCMMPWDSWTRSMDLCDVGAEEVEHGLFLGPGLPSCARLSGSGH